MQDSSCVQSQLPQVDGSTPATNAANSHLLALHQWLLRLYFGSRQDRLPRILQVSVGPRHTRWSFCSGGEYLRWLPDGQRSKVWVLAGSCRCIRSLCIAVLGSFGPGKPQWGLVFAVGQIHWWRHDWIHFRSGPVRFTAASPKSGASATLVPLTRSHPVTSKHG